MPSIVTIGGSPSATSKSAALLGLVRARLETFGITTAGVNVRDLPAEDLLFARSSALTIASAVELVASARGVVVATPIYKAAYSGILKAFLDLLPQDALAGKVVLPIATGGSLAHMLAIDYALRPVLSALGSTHILGGVYLQDSQFINAPGAEVQLEVAADDRLNSTIKQLAGLLTSRG